MSLITIIVAILLIILGFSLLVFLIFNSLGFFAGAPYAATPAEIVNKLFTIVSVGKDDIVYDLGSGDGRILIEAAKRGAKGVGWEINFPLYLWSVRRIKQFKLEKKVKIHFGNFWTKKLGKATVIFAFLLPEHMERLERKLEKELQPGTKVITYLAKLPNRKPVREEAGLAVYQF